MKKRLLSLALAVSCLLGTGAAFAQRMEGPWTCNVINNGQTMYCVNEQGQFWIFNL